MPHDYVIIERDPTRIEELAEYVQAISRRSRPSGEPQRQRRESHGVGGSQAVGGLVLRYRHSRVGAGAASRTVERGDDVIVLGDEKQIESLRSYLD